MRLVTTLAATLALASVMAPSPASAQVTYDFSAIDGPLGTSGSSFSFTSPDFITSFQRVNSGNSNSCLIGGTACTTDQFLDSYNGNDVITLQPGPGAQAFFYFDLGAFRSPGTYNTVFDFENATLVVTDLSGAVPEPATWAMMLVGFGAVGYGMRRRRSATALRTA